MLRAKPHKNLILWEKALDFVSAVYEITKGFPKDEEFGLKSQLRRAAVSVPSNIAEGLTRNSRKDKLHFLNIAQSSPSEIDAQIEISLRLGYLTTDRLIEFENSITTVEQLLSGLIRSMR